MRVLSAVAAIALIVPTLALAQVRRGGTTTLRPPPVKAEPKPGSNARTDSSGTAAGANTMSRALRIALGSKFWIGPYTSYSQTRIGRSVSGNALSVDMPAQGLQAGYRISRGLSISGDIIDGGTQVQGSFRSTTGSLGLHYQMTREGYHVHPYAQAMVSGMGVTQNEVTPRTGPILPGDNFSNNNSTVRATGSGLGGMAGAGFQFDVFNSFSLTTGVNYSAHHINSIYFDKKSAGSAYNYNVGTTRFTIGLAYTGRLLR